MSFLSESLPNLAQADYRAKATERWSGRTTLITPIFGGATEIQKEIISRSLGL